MALINLFMADELSLFLLFNTVCGSVTLVVLGQGHECSALVERVRFALSGICWSNVTFIGRLKYVAGVH